MFFKCSKVWETMENVWEKKVGISYFCLKSVKTPINFNFFCPNCPLHNGLFPKSAIDRSGLAGQTISQRSSPPASVLSPPRPEALGGAGEQNPGARVPDPTPLTAKKRKEKENKKVEMDENKKKIENWEDVKISWREKKIKKLPFYLLLLSSSLFHLLLSSFIW